MRSLTLTALRIKMSKWPATTSNLANMSKLERLVMIYPHKLQFALWGKILKFNGNGENMLVHIKYVSPNALLINCSNKVKDNCTIHHPDQLISWREASNFKDFFLEPGQLAQALIKAIKDSLKIV